MVEPGIVKGIAILAGMGGLLTGALLERVGQRIAAPHRHKEARARRPRRTGEEQTIIRVSGLPPSPNRTAERSTVADVENLPQTRGQPVNAHKLGKVVIAEPIRVGPSRVRNGRSSRLVKPVDRPYWQLQHWKEAGDRLTGFYRTPYGSYEGYILHPNAPRPQFFIKKPPAALKEHPHWICFHSVGKGTYSIHFSPAPPTPDAGILEVEKVLGEALSGKGRRHA